MGDKLPALQFYPGDWRKDPGVRALTAIERYVWFEMLLVMHEAEPRGYFALNGKPYPLDLFARSIGVKSNIVTGTISKLDHYGVCSRSESNLILSRRMVKDETLRQVRKAAGSLGGNPKLVNQKTTKGQPPPQPRGKPNSNLVPTPSSSSSSSISSTDQELGSGLGMSANADTLPTVSKRDPKVLWPKYPAVLLTEAEKPKLVAAYQAKGLDKHDLEDGFRVLQSYSENGNAKKFKAYKNHYLVMIGWVLQEVIKRKKAGSNTVQRATFKQLEDLDFQATLESR